MADRVVYRGPAGKGADLGTGTRNEAKKKGYRVEGNASRKLGAAKDEEDEEKPRQRKKEINKMERGGRGEVGNRERQRERKGKAKE